MGLVKTVAKAVHDTSEETAPWMYDDIAWSAIESMRDPTEEMLRSGLEAMFACDDGYYASMRAAWNAMIDAALEEDE